MSGALSVAVAQLRDLFVPLPTVESVTPPAPIMRAERLAALVQLLQLEDERSLRGKRGHRVTQVGARDRMTRLWLPSQRTWAAARVAPAPLDGWLPAQPLRVVSRGPRRWREG